MHRVETRGDVRVAKLREILASAVAFSCDREMPIRAAAALASSNSASGSEMAVFIPEYNPSITNPHLASNDMVEPPHSRTSPR